MLEQRISKTNTRFDRPQCPCCLGNSIIKKGKSPQTHKQQYKCKDCNKLFLENPDKVSSKYYLPENITPQEMFNYDIWDLRVLGKEPATNGQYTLKFSDINIDWIKRAIKKWIYYRAANNEVITLQKKLETIKDFARTIEIFSVVTNPDNLNRAIIQDYITYLQSKGNKKQTIAGKIGNLREFLNDCRRFNWVKLGKTALVYEEDFPKKDKRLPRFIPSNIVSQINNSLDSLPEPIALIVRILQETGMRSIEIPTLKLNCIRQDSTGGYWIDFIQRKMKKEICVCISPELANNIFKQQDYIKKLFDNSFNYL